MSLMVFCAVFENAAIEELVRVSPFLSMIRQYTHADYKDIYEWYLKNEKLLGPYSKEYWYMDFREDTINCNNKIISKDKKDGLNIIKSYLILGSHSIPNMYYYEVDKQSVRITSPTLSNNIWIIQFLKSKELDRNFISKLNFSIAVNNFADINQGVIDSIHSQFTTVPIMLGSGVSGCVFDIGDQKVLKVFDDKFEYNKAKEAQQRLFNNPIISKTEAKIYDIGILGEFKSEILKLPKIIYYYIMEKVNPIFVGETNESTDIKSLSIDPYKIKELTDYLVMTVDQFRKIDKSLDKIKNIDRDFEDEEVENIVKKLASYILSKPFPIRITKTIKELSEKERLKSGWLKLFVKELIYKYLTGRGDTHIGNIGLTPYGELRIFDPSFEKHQDKLHH